MENQPHPTNMQPRNVYLEMPGYIPPTDPNQLGYFGDARPVRKDIVATDPDRTVEADKVPTQSPQHTPLEQVINPSGLSSADWYLAHARKALESSARTSTTEITPQGRIIPSVAGNDAIGQMQRMAKYDLEKAAAGGDPSVANEARALLASLPEALPSTSRSERMAAFKATAARYAGRTLLGSYEGLRKGREALALFGRKLGSLAVRVVATSAQAIGEALKK